MAKRKSKQLPKERMCISLEVVFEGNECIAVQVGNRFLSYEKVGAVGKRLVRLASVMYQWEQVQKTLNEISGSLDTLRWGDRR